MQNKEIIFANRPTGMPTLDTFKFVDTEVPQLEEGEVLNVRLSSSRSYLRGRMREEVLCRPFSWGRDQQQQIGEVVGRARRTSLAIWWWVGMAAIQPGRCRSFVR